MLDTKTIYETAMKQINDIEPIPLTYLNQNLILNMK